MRLRNFFVRLTLLCIGVIVPINFFMITNLERHLGGNNGNNKSYPWGPSFQDPNRNIHVLQAYRRDRIHATSNNRHANSYNKTYTTTTTTTHVTPPSELKQRRAHKLPNKQSVGNKLERVVGQIVRFIIGHWQGGSDADQAATKRKLAISRLWPEVLQNSSSRSSSSNPRDRILEQLKYTPRDVPRDVPRDEKGKNKLKTILALNMRVGRGDGGRAIFERDKCPVRACSLRVKGDVEAADAVVFKNLPPPKVFKTWKKGNNSVWVWYELESPLHSGATGLMNNHVNWTATYRRDSTIVAPYERFVPFANATNSAPSVNYAANKTGMVAWFVSNCKDKIGRLNYALELRKHVSVDIYGGCGNMSCPRRQSGPCFNMLKRKYKFYLSFENSACRDYISEKFYWNALQ